MKKALTTVFLLLVTTVMNGQSSGDVRLRFSEPYRLHPGAVNQTEVFITKHPLDDNILFASCNTLNFIPFFISEGIFVTTDGGATWQGSDTCSGDPLLYHGGDPGIAIQRDGTFILTRLGRSPFAGLYSHYSTDNGLTWSVQKAISTDDLERAALAADASSSGSFGGRTYAAWVKFAYPFPVMVAITDDNGQNWSLPQQINNPPNRSAGGDVAIGPEGEVYVCWAGVTDISPFREIYAGFASSGDGGATWEVTENAFPMNGITGILPEKDNIRVNGLPALAVDTTNGPRRGWIYMVTGQKGLLPAGTDPDIVLYRSADGGATWSAGIRVNQDGLNNGKIQYFPAVEVDRYGGVNVLFYDDRNTSSDSAGVFLARSADGGDTWNEWEISGHRFRPTPIGGLGQGYQGDNIDLVTPATTLWPVWMDNSTGVYQVWTAPIALQEIIGTEESLPAEFACVVRPNPFYQSTMLDVRCWMFDVGCSMLDAGCRLPAGKAGIPDIQDLRIEVYDVNGRMIKVLDEGRMAQGRYEVPFTPAEGAGNIFFYRLLWGARCVSGMLIRIGEP